MRAAALGLLLLLAASRAASAGAPSYADANQAYSNGDWQSAARQYEALVAAGVVNPDLYYNLGNAYFRMGRLGPAVYQYQRALRIDPGAGDAAHNLALARRTIAERWEDKIGGAEADPLWVTLATLLPPGLLSLGFLTADLLFFAALIGLRLLAAGRRRTLVKGLAALSGAAALFAGVLLCLHIWYMRTPMGIVIADEVGMHEGRNADSQQRSVIHAGMRVEITGRDEGWLRVELSNQTEGWVPADTIGEL